MSGASRQHKGEVVSDENVISIFNGKMLFFNFHNGFNLLEHIVNK